MNHLASRHRHLLAYDTAVRRALDEVLGLTSAFAHAAHPHPGELVAERTAGASQAGQVGETDDPDDALHPDRGGTAKPNTDPTGTDSTPAASLGSANHAESADDATRREEVGGTPGAVAVRPAPGSAYALVDAAAAALVPVELCEQLLGGTPAPAELPAYVAAWLEAADPSPLEAALVLYATGAHIGLPELGLAGRRRIGEALEKFRRHYGLADDQLVAHLSEAATVWSPVHLWVAAAAARDARLVRTRELPDQLRQQAARAEAARREAEERSRALAADTNELMGRLDRLRRENDAFRTTAERLRNELDALGAEAARAVDLEAQLARVRAREADMRIRLDELEQAFAADNGAADSADADEDDASEPVEQPPDLSAVYLLVLHSNDKDNTPAEVRDELLARGIGHVETQRIDESRVPASFPRGAIVAIDASFMSHPVAEKAYDNAIAAAAPVFRFTKLGPARLHRRLVRFLRDQYEAAGEDERPALPGTRDRP